MNLANEGLEAKKKEEEIASRKRKAEEEQTWEGAHLVLDAWAWTHLKSFNSQPRTASRLVACFREQQHEKEKESQDRHPRMNTFSHLRFQACIVGMSFQTFFNTHYPLALHVYQITLCTPPCCIINLALP